MRTAACIALSLLIVLLAASKTDDKFQERTHTDIFRDMESFNYMISGLKNIRISEIGQGPVSVSVAYARKKGIRLTQSTMGREDLIVAADQMDFWFWSRSFDPNSVYHCDRQDVRNTKVRPELYPCVLIGILCADPIPSETTTIVNGPSCPLIITVEDGITRELELKDGRIVSQVFYSGVDPLVSVKFTEFQDSCGFTLPKKASVLWYEQGRRITLNFGEAEVNMPDDVDTSVPQGLQMVNLEGF